MTIYLTLDNSEVEITKINENTFRAYMKPYYVTKFKQIDVGWNNDEYKELQKGYDKVISKQDLEYALEHKILRETKHLYNHKSIE